MPVKEQLFNGSICRSSAMASSFDGSVHASRRNRGHEETFSPLEVALPALLPRHDGYVRARWVTLRARWVTLRALWVTLRALWVTLRARWVTLRDA